MSWGRIARTSVAVVALVAPALRVRLDETAVPLSSDVPDLPAGVTITADEVA